MPSVSLNTYPNGLAGPDDINGIDLVDLASDDGVELQQSSNSQVNGHASKAVDMIDLSLLDDDTGLTDQSDYLPNESDLNEAQEWLHDTQPVDFGLSRSPSPEDTSSQYSMHSDDLSSELLKSIGDIKKAKQSEATSDEDDMSYFLGPPVRKKRPPCPKPRALGDLANLTPISKPKLMPSLLEGRTENDVQQIERSAKLREANLQKRQDRQLRRESRGPDESQAKGEPSLPQITPQDDTARSTRDDSARSDDVELWGSPVPETEHEGPSFNTHSPVTNGQQPSSTVVAEATNSSTEDARDHMTAILSAEKAKQHEKARPKKARFLPFGKFEPSTWKDIKKPTISGSRQPTRQSNGLIDHSIPSEIVHGGSTRLDSIASAHHDPKYLSVRNTLRPDQAAKLLPSSNLRPNGLNHGQNAKGILSKVSEYTSVKEQKHLITQFLRDLKSIRLVLEETAKYRCMHVLDSKGSNEVEEIRRFTNAVLGGEVHDTPSRKRVQDIKDNMKRRTGKAEREMSAEEEHYFRVQTADDRLPSLAASVLGGTVFVDVIGAIAVLKERQRHVTHQCDLEQKQAYRIRHPKQKKGKPKPAKPSKTERLDQLLRTYNAAEEANNVPATAIADEVIELGDHSESDVELTSDEDETVEEYAARKKRKKEHERRAKVEERAALDRARLKAEQAQTYEEHRRADYESQETTRGAFNAAKEYPPGFDRKRIFQQHEPHFNENKVIEAGIWTAGQGRLPSPTAAVAEEDSESDNVVGRPHDAEDDMLVDSDSDSAMSIAEECFEYLVKGQKYRPGASPSSSDNNSSDKRTYYRCLSLSSAHAYISTLLTRHKISRKDAQGGLRVTIELSPGELNVVDQTIAYLGTGKIAHFWIEKRQVYAEGKVARKAFAPRTLFQVHETRTTTIIKPVPVPADASDDDDLFSSPPPPPPPPPKPSTTTTTTTTPHPAVYTTLSTANRAALDTFLSTCARHCDAPAFLDRQRTLMLAKLGGRGIDGDEEEAFDERKRFSDVGVRKKREGGGWVRRGEEGVEGMEGMEEVRVWVGRVEVRGPRN